MSWERSIEIYVIFKFVVCFILCCISSLFRKSVLFMWEWARISLYFCSVCIQLLVSRIWTPESSLYSNDCCYFGCHCLWCWLHIASITLVTHEIVCLAYLIALSFHFVYQFPSINSAAQVHAQIIIKYYIEHWLARVRLMAMRTQRDTRLAGEWDNRDMVRTGEV